ncbi:MAG: hypothetical protein GC179_26335 [Anaerolineaceae bacterium]|nr:hypothetical protein [Anaerolineaceae bacterium]
MSQTVGIYLMVDFDWPNPFEQAHAKLARHLHDVLQNKSWIKESVAASGGVGGYEDSSWVFWLENYAALDKLLRSSTDEVAQAYRAFFSAMPHVTEKIREEVQFL